MVLSVADRVLETSTTTGTGTLNLAGAVTGFRSFISALGSGKKTVYFMDDGTNWEVGIGTVTSGSPNTLSRTTVLASSNSNALVNWGAGTRNVRIGPSAFILPYKDENLNLIVGHGGAASGSANAQTITLDPAPTAYSDGMIISWYSQGAVTGTLTINVNSLGAKTVKWRGADLASGAFASGNLIIGIYKASSGFVELITPPANAFLTDVLDGSVTFLKLASSIIASVSDMVSGTLSKILTASNFKTYTDNIKNSWVRLDTANGSGSTNTYIRRFSNSAQGSYTTDLTYTDSATLGASITVNTSGVYAITYQDQFSATNQLFGVSKNSSQLNTAISLITAANRLGLVEQVNNSTPMCFSLTIFLTAGDVIRPHINNATSNGSTPAFSNFTMQRLV